MRNTLATTLATQHMSEQHAHTVTKINNNIFLLFNKLFLAFFTRLGFSLIFICTLVSDFLLLNFVNVKFLSSTVWVRPAPAPCHSTSLRFWTSLLAIKLFYLNVFASLLTCNNKSTNNNNNQKIRWRLTADSCLVATTAMWTWEVLTF